ncbi:Hypothetical protein POVR2_LOCUS397 [uncultured virus]|nr:Hypothetical protein POVR2_LOCUS397 [uncultured virus]
MNSIPRDVFDLILDRLEPGAMFQLHNTSMLLRSRVNLYARQLALQLVNRQLVSRPDCSVQVGCSRQVELGDPWQYGLRHLDTLLVLIEVYGLPSIEYSDKAWKHTMSSDVLAYLISIELLHAGSYSIRLSIDEAVALDDLSEVIALIDLGTNVIRASLIKSTLHSVASRGKSDMLRELLTPYHAAARDDIDILAAATRSNNRQTIELLLSLLDREGIKRAIDISLTELAEVSLDALLHYRPPSASRLLKIFKELVSKRACLGKMIAVLVQHGLTLLPVKWRALLNSGIQRTDVELIRLALEHIDMNSKMWSELGSETSRLSKRDQAITLAVKAVRQSTNADLHKSSMQVLRLLLNDSGVDIDNLGTALAEQVVKLLHAEILAFAHSQQPTRVQFMNYLLSLHWRELALAASSVLDTTEPYSMTVAPYRALFISLLYPTLTLEEARAALEIEGYDDETLELSMKLIKSI